jgi:hypothetical protein
MGEMRNEYKTLIRSPEGKKPLGRPMHRWNENSGTYLREIGAEGVDWMHVVRDKTSSELL